MDSQGGKKRQGLKLLVNREIKESNEINNVLPRKAADKVRAHWRRGHRVWGGGVS